MRLSAVALGLALLASQGLADPVTEATEEVLEAFKAGDAEALARLACAPEPGAWILAHELCALGHHEAALSLAKAAPGKDLERLPAYVAMRRGKGNDAATRRILRAAMKHIDEGDAQACLDASDEMVLEGDNVLEAHIMSLRAHALGSLDRLEECAETFCVAATAAERLGDLRAAVDAYHLGGSFAYKMRYFITARESWSSRAAIEKSRGNARGEAEALELVARTHQDVQEMEPLVGIYERLLELYERLGRTREVARTSAKLGVTHSKLGDYQRALRRVEQARKLAEEDGAPGLLADVLSSYGSVYLALGEKKKALSQLLRCLELRKNQGDPIGVALAHIVIGQCYVGQREFDEALPHFEAARKNLERTRSPYLAFALAFLGNLCEHKKEYERAFDFHERAIRVAEGFRNPRLLATCVSGLADAHLAAEKYEEALPILKKSIALATQVGHPELVLRAHWAAANCLVHLDRPAEAIDEVRPAVEIITRSFRGIGEEQGAEARADVARVFDLGVRAARELNDAPRAFFYLESGRAGTLLESLGGRAKLREVAIPEDLRADEARARITLAKARNRLRAAERARHLKNAMARKKELVAASEKLKDVVQKIQREAKSGASLLYPSPVPLEEAQGTLAQDEALVTYAMLPYWPIALVVTAKEARIVRLGPREPLVEACDHLVLDDPEEDPTDRLAKLRALVMDPLGLGKEIKRILVSPDGVLSYVPLGLLASAREVVYVPSATTYCILREERHLRGGKILALGDPDYNGDLEPLPHTRKEVKAVGDVRLLGKEATKAGLLAALDKRERWRAVHLACHGLVDLERPTLSSLAIADGRLTAYEVMRMDFAADLVVLSACETGTGKVLRGEGLMGLTRAFMLAGAPRVIVSLWRVEDEATQALMKEFYRLWKNKGVPAATALKRAKRHVRAREKWSHPLYWAAWQLWGLPD